MSHSQQQYHLSGSSVSSMINPEKPKIARNHQSDYVAQLRQMQRENRIRKERDRYEQDKKQFKMKKFSQVKSKVDRSAPKALQKTSSNSQINDKENQSKQFSKINKDQLKSIAAANRKKNPSTKTKTITKPTVPKHNETLELKPRQSKNYLNQNAKTVVQSAATKQTKRKNSEDGPKHKNYGKVPQYIENYKSERREEAERQKAAAAKRKDCPPGMVLMEESERLETLRCLEENKKNVNQQLMKFPIVCDTIGLKKRKAQVEDKLQEIEEAIRLFSRPRVFVAE